MSGLHLRVNLIEPEPAADLVGMGAPIPGDHDDPADAEGAKRLNRLGSVFTASLTNGNRAEQDPVASQIESRADRATRTTQLRVDGLEGDASVIGEEVMTAEGDLGAVDPAR